MPQSRGEYLLNSYLQRTATAAEEEEFMELLRQGGDVQHLEEGLLEFIRSTGADYSLSDRSQTAVIRAILSAERSEEAVSMVRTSMGRPWVRYAAVFILFTALAGYLWKQTGRNGHKSLVAAGAKMPGKKQDAEPGGSKALLTLSDGTTVILDSASNGSLAEQGGIKILKMNAGTLAYNATSKGLVMPGNKTVYNTISTPPGGQYQLVLADGTKVWLNAASSLRFPVAFTGSTRKVEVKGEAYFEIAPDRSRPFTVTADSVTVDVLGTSFNINAYDDEASVNTTLVTGAVRVKAGKNAVLLDPGQQAQVQQKDAPVKLLKNADVEQLTAWVSGNFVFNETPIESAMRQLGRWYNMEITYEGKTPKQTFNGVLSRNNSLAKVLKILEIGNVHFRLDGERIIVMP